MFLSQTCPYISQHLDPNRSSEPGLIAAGERDCQDEMGKTVSL